MPTSVYRTKMHASFQASVLLGILLATATSFSVTPRHYSPRHYEGSAGGRSSPKRLYRSDATGGSVALSASPRTSSDPAAEDEARDLRERAETLRREVGDFLREKDDAIRAEEEERDRFEAERRRTRERYSAEVPILKGDGATEMERVEFPPRIDGGGSHVGRGVSG